MPNRLSILYVLMLLAGECVAQDVGFLQLTEGQGDHRYPAWSAEEGYLALESNRDGNWEIYALKIEDGSLVNLTRNPADDRYPAWDRESRRILFQSTRTGQPELHLLDMMSGESHLLIHLDGAEMFPSWSSDGRKMAFSIEVDSVSQIAVLESTGAYKVLAPSPFKSVWPRWSPDGRRIAFFSRRDTDGQDDEIYVLNETDSTLQRLTNRSGHDFCPAWSPDGQRIAAVGIESDGSLTLRIIPVDGGAINALRTPFFRMTEPAWSHDGRFIAVAAKRTADDPYHIFVVAIDR